MNGWELGSQLQGEGGTATTVGLSVGGERTSMASAQDQRHPWDTPCSNVDRLTTISERIHLRGNQTKGKVGRVESLDQPHLA